MVTSNHLNSNQLPFNTIKANIIDKLSNTIDMLIKASSIANVNPEKDSDSQVRSLIYSIESALFTAINHEYDNLLNFLQQNPNSDTYSQIADQMSLHPQFLHPTYLLFGNEECDQIFPLKMFTHKESTIQLLPHAIHLCNSHRLYQFCECGGLLRQYRQYISRTGTLLSTNLIIELIRKGNHTVINQLHDQFWLNGKSFSDCSSLQLLYDPANQAAWNYFVQRDPSILCRPIGNHHPIVYLTNTFKATKNYQSCCLERIFDFILDYISLAARYFPRESGFIFLQADREEQCSIIVDIHLRQNELFNDNRLSKDRDIFDHICNVFDNLPDNTGFFHNVLLHLSPDFTELMNRIEQKGDYYNHDEVRKSMLYCFMNRSIFHNDAEIELDILYTMIRTWPQTVLEYL